MWSYSLDGHVEAADDGDGDLVELVHHRFGGGGEFVNDRHFRDLQVIAFGVDLSDVGADWVHAADADGDVGQSVAPGATEGVGDDYGDIDLASGDEAAADFKGGGGGIDGQERDGFAAADVGLVDAGVGADPAVAGFGEDEASRHADDALRLAEDQFDRACVLFPVIGPVLGEPAGADVVEADDAALGLGDDLLGDEEDVAGFERGLLGEQRGVDQFGEVVALDDLGDATDGEYAVLGGRGHQSIPTMRTAAWVL